MLASAKLSFTIKMTDEVGGSQGVTNVFLLDCWMVVRVYWVVARSSLDGCLLLQVKRADPQV